MLDSAALAFSLLASLATGILFGLAPAFQGKAGRNRPLWHFAKGAAVAPPARAAARLQAVLVIGELALALMLVTSAGLLVRSFPYCYQ